MKYRREIDGLRAIAVLPVIFHHAGVKVFSGGFVGVDIFFVISGYLITSIILEELSSNSFSISRFYERRARRILPALFVVLLSCLPFAWVFMGPGQMESFSESLIATVLFLSNVHFWQGFDYFAAASEEQPLLHTWSLAVEEQFYLIFPVLLILLWRFGRNPTFFSIVILTSLSLLLSEWGWRNEPKANFYFTFSRFWELLAGSICALYLSEKERIDSSALSIAGLIMVLASVFFFDENTPVPSVYSAITVMGTSLIILFGRAGTYTAAILSNRVLVGIGLLSYSAYLWHNPIFAFAKIRSVSPMSPLTIFLLITATFILSFMSWKFVEQPFRRKSNQTLSKRRNVFTFAALGIGAFTAIGIYGQSANGLSNRMTGLGISYAELGVDQKVQTNLGLHKDCVSGFSLSPNCRTDENPSVLIWGDSYAMHIVEWLKASNSDVSFIQMTESSCPPIRDVTLFKGIRKSEKCLKFNEEVFEWLKNSPQISLIVLSSPFSYVLRDDSLIYSKNSGRHNADLSLVTQTFQNTLKSIQGLGKEVLIVSPPPQNGLNIGKCLVHSVLYAQGAEHCDFSRNEFNHDTLIAYEFLKVIDEDYDVAWLDKAICGLESCYASIDGVFIYNDSGHLSIEGSRYLGESTVSKGVLQLNNRKARLD